MNRRIVFVILIILAITFSVLLSSCQFNNIVTEKGEYKVTNINIFKGTPVWEIALAVRDEKVDTIEKMGKEKSDLLNYQEPKYGATLLLWAVGMEKYKSAEA